MRKVLFALMISCSSLGFASREVVQMAPLCEECPKILHYRMLFMESDIIDLEEHLEEAKGNLDEMQYRYFKFMVTRLKYHIGFPVELEEMEFPR